MIVTSDFFDSMKGRLSDEYYLRNVNGKIILSKRPTKVSDKQLECRRIFAEKYAKKKSNK